MAIANCTSILKQCAVPTVFMLKMRKFIKILRFFPLFFCLFGNNTNCHRNAAALEIIGRNFFASVNLSKLRGLNLMHVYLP